MLKHLPWLIGLSGLILVAEIYAAFNINLNRGKFLGFSEIFSLFSAGFALFAILCFTAGHSKKFIGSLGFVLLGLSILVFARDLWTVSNDYLRFFSALHANQQKLRSGNAGDRCDAAVSILYSARTYSDLPGTRSTQREHQARETIQKTIDHFSSLHSEEVEAATRSLFSLMPLRPDGGLEFQKFQTEYDVTGLQKCSTLPPQDRRGQMAALLLANITGAVSKSSEPFFIQVLSRDTPDEYQEYIAIQVLRDHAKKSELTGPLTKALQAYVRRPGVPETDYSRQFAREIMKE